MPTLHPLIDFPLRSMSIEMSSGMRGCGYTVGSRKQRGVSAWAPKIGKPTIADLTMKVLV